MVAVLSIAGDQVPVTPLFDVVGNSPKTSPITNRVYLSEGWCNQWIHCDRHRLIDCTSLTGCVLSGVKVYVSVAVLLISW